MSIVAGTAATIEAAFVDQDGDAITPSEPVTVHVTGFDGTDVLPAAHSTTVTGKVVSVALTATQTASLDVLTATWTDAAGRTVVTVTEVVGGVYASVDAVRSSDPTLTTARHPAAKVRDARAFVEEEFEGAKIATGVAWVPRIAVDERHDGPLLSLNWPQVRRIRRIRAFTSRTEYVDLDQDMLDTFGPSVDRMLDLRGVVPSGCCRVDITYEHGFDRLNASMLRASLVRIRHLLNSTASGIPDRAVTYMPAGGGGTFSIATPGKRGAVTGISEVDAVLVANTHVDIAAVDDMSPVIA